MRISKRSQYGLRAMVTLTLYEKEGPLSARGISKNQEIPLQYLEQILNRLKKKKLVKTVRGPRGGYALSREASKIKIRDITEALEDKNFLTDCIDKKRASCSRINTCAARIFWKRLDYSIKKVLDSATLQDLCLKRPRKAKGPSIGHSYLFQI